MILQNRLENNDSSSFIGRPEGISTRDSYKPSMGDQELLPQIPSAGMLKDYDGLEVISTTVFSGRTSIKYWM